MKKCIEHKVIQLLLYCMKVRADLLCLSTFYLTVIVNAIIFINKFCFKPTEFIYHLLSESLGNIDEGILQL